ncbi:hypothetical protein [Mesorhizobium carmichaelinearum]|uniref:hypothetical protein n=1 Tax=Mesorhizobium carmichaelinearum TaxID=1208188 RepID=UPI000BA36BAD|nr:hypothetical protein [Mesorhizobium carmichaelinearum]
MYRLYSKLSSVLAAGLLVCNSVTAAYAAGAQYCDRTDYSAQAITDAVKNSSLHDELKTTSCSLGGLGRFESGGNKGVYNGSCCTGIFQLNNTNIKNYAGMSRSEFGCQSLQFQVDTWAKLTNDGYNSAPVKQLIQMGTFDGQKVDGSFIAACIQLGTGNCQQMVRSGRCSGFSDINGTTICDMAKNARSMADASCQEGDTAACLGPGDFNTGGDTKLASAAPGPTGNDINVASGQV